MPLDKETIQQVAEQTASYIRRTNHKTVKLINDQQNWNTTILKKVKKTCKRNNITLKIINIRQALHTKQLQP
jgi:ABC-type branched-subunit amino acid transport system substrate-binding protein